MLVAVSDNFMAMACRGPFQEHAGASSGLEVRKQGGRVGKTPVSIHGLSHVLFDHINDCLTKAGGRCLLAVIVGGVIVDVCRTLIVSAAVHRSVVDNHRGILVDEWRVVLEKNEVFVNVPRLDRFLAFLAIHETAVVEVVFVDSWVFCLKMAVVGVFIGSGIFKVRYFHIRVVSTRGDILRASRSGLVLRSHDGCLLLGSDVRM